MKYFRLWFVGKVGIVSPDPGFLGPSKLSAELRAKQLHLRDYVIEKEK
jgi:hypothetical protein